MTIGATCDLVAVATDGRTQSFRITVVQSGPAFSQCCGYPLPPYSGQWVTFKPLGFDPSEVVVDFNRDGGVGDGGVGKIDGGNDTAPALQGIFVPTGSMTVARVFHTATLLGNGKVLIAGGLDASSNCLSSAELYDPATGTFKATGSMTAARQYHTATLLSNGKVLIAGGQSVQTNNNGLTSAELYDPAAGTFTATGSMIWDSQSDTATLLPSGEVLMAGGYDTISFDPSAHAELYDPAAGTFKNTGEMAVERTGAAATLLPSGRVLIAGGSATNPTSAELYDPATGLFTATGSMTGTAGDTAMLLGNGKVLIAGSGAPELYDPGSGTFTVTGSMSFPGQGRHTVTLLPSGEVLIAGGLDTSYDVWTAINTAELYDPSVGTFTATRSMTTERWGHTATLLPNGKVLITGGGFLAVHASAELYE